MERSLLPPLHQFLRLCNSNISTKSTLPLLFFSHSSSFFFSTLPRGREENPPFIVDYMVRTFNYTQEKALTASKCVLHINSSEKPDSVLSFLRRFGVSDSKIATAVYWRPSILAADVDSTLIPKIKLLQDLGAPDNEIADVICTRPHIFGTSIERTLVPAIAFLKSILGADERVWRAITRCPRLLTTNVDKTVSQNVSFLRSKGLTGSQISSFFQKSPNSLISKPEYFKSSCEWLEGVGIGMESGMYSYVISVVSSMSKESLDNKLAIFKAFGFSESDVFLLFKRIPYVLVGDAGKLKRKLEFLVNTLEYDAPTLLRRPTVLLLSVDAKLVPRYRVFQILKSKGLISEKKSLLSVFILPEKKFLEYISKFKDEELALREAYKGGNTEESSLRTRSLGRNKK